MGTVSMVSVSMVKQSVVLSLLATLLLAGCGGTPLRESLPSTADRLVAKDFAQLLVQVESLSPDQTTLRMARSIGTSDTFHTALKEELQIAGYVVEPITTELVSDKPTVGHYSERSPTVDGEMVVYNVNVGEIIFRRGYTIDDEGLVSPVTAMEAKGIDSSVLSQDDSIFDLETDAPVAGIALQASPEGSDSVSAQLPEPIQEELIVIPAVVDASVSQSEENVLLSTRIVDESLLTFDGNSLVLGESNKRRVRNMVTIFQPKTDVFSVLGCVFHNEVTWSEDATQIAIARAQRIQSELLYAGIPADKIQAEACAEDKDTGAPIIPIGSVLLLLNRSS